MTRSAATWLCPMPLPTPAIEPSWFGLITFAMLLSPDGTLVMLSELEPVLARRFFATQRAAGGGSCILATALSTALSPNEAAIIAALAAAGKAA